MVHKIAIVYLSYGGNTRDLANVLSQELNKCGFISHTYSQRDEFNYDDYDYFLFGSLTWDEGKLPIQMRKYLRKILIDEPVEIKSCSVFGTGETQWGNFCRAVDEMEYHFKKNNVKVDLKLKIEQNPIGKETQIKEYIKELSEVLLH